MFSIGQTLPVFLVHICLTCIGTVLAQWCIILVLEILVHTTLGFRPVILLPLKPLGNSDIAIAIHYRLAIMKVKTVPLNLMEQTLLLPFDEFLDARQRYTYRVLQTIQIELILLCVWAESVILGSAKTALKIKYEIWIG